MCELSIILISVIVFFYYVLLFLSKFRVLLIMFLMEEYFNFLWIVVLNNRVYFRIYPLNV